MNGYQKQNIKIKIRLTSNKTINGYVNMDGFNRVSDYINSLKINFIPVYNATYEGHDKSELLINRNNIEFIRLDNKL